MIHVLLASALPLSLFFVAWWRDGRRTSARALTAVALASTLSSAWAVTPDIPRLLGNMPLYSELHRWNYCDVWWFHCAIDRHDDIDSSMVFPALFVLAAIAVFVVGWRELAALESERDR